MSILDKLTEGIVSRDLSAEGAALVAKWEQTGLLEGLNEGPAGASKQGMARLLETQAKELLREASMMSQGDVEGFAAVAFPIVRRVFGNLIANELVSVQPMSLPSGLIFFLDFRKDGARLGDAAGASVYGGNVVGQAITGGVDLTDNDDEAESGFYSLSNGYSSPTGSTAVQVYFEASGTFMGSGSDAAGAAGHIGIGGTNQQQQLDALVRYDPDFISGTTVIAVARAAVSAFDQPNLKNLVAFDINNALSGGFKQIHRLTQMSGGAGNAKNDSIHFVFASDTAHEATELHTKAAISALGHNTYTITYPQEDDFGGTATAGAANAIGAVRGTTDWGLEAQAKIPEINVKVDSVSITAMTKKLKARWTPELGQDLNAYHNLDAEVELTSILSEHIALEIDREIVEDLLKGAKAGVYYWSRSPGMFVNKATGRELGIAAAAPDFTGTVSEWYETLLETVNDLSAVIHRKVLRGGATFIVTSPEVCSILEFTAGFRASVTVDGDKGTAGALKVGTVSKKWDIYCDPYFPRNVLLIGRKGSSFLESGYVYAPYVPLQVTPTIFGPDDFTPRKGVITRYAKKMVRPDMYGVVIVRGLLGEAGSAN